MDFLTKIKNLLRYCKITKAAGNSGDFSKQQLEYFGKTADAVVIFPFGMFANIDADTLAVMGSINAHEENRVILGVAPPNRPNLAAGEVAIYHPNTGSKITMKSDGTVEIDASTVTFTGDVAVQGDLTVGAANTDFLTHLHIGSPSAPTGAVSNTGTVIP